MIKEEIDDRIDLRKRESNFALKRLADKYKEFDRIVYKNRFLPTFSWAMYDFANTIFSAVVVTFYFPTYIEEITKKPFSIGAANTFSMVIAGLIVPIAGALSDRTGRTKSYLILITILCCFFTGFISAPEPKYENLHLFLLFFILANILYQSALVFYNSLLPTVATEDKIGFYSGFGIGLGYLGVIFGLVITYFFHERTAFFLSAVMFFVFTVPLIIFVRERKVENPEGLNLALIKNRFKELASTLKSLPKYPRVLLFFIANFLCIDALNTVIVFFALYLKKTFHKDVKDLIPFVIALNVCAFLFGCLLGKMSDRISTKKVMIFCGFSLALSIFLSGVLENFALVITIIISFGAIGLSGLWTTGRKFLIEIAPQEKIGEYFGLYGLTGKLSSFGCIFFAILAGSFGYRFALLCMLCTIVPGTIILFFIKPQRLK